MPAKPAPVPEPGRPTGPDSGQVERACLVILTLAAAGAALSWAAEILTPPAMALFLAMVIDGFARVLDSRLSWLPRRAALMFPFGRSNLSSVARRRAHRSASEPREPCDRARR